MDRTTPAPGENQVFLPERFFADSQPMLGIRSVMGFIGARRAAAAWRRSGGLARAILILFHTPSGSKVALTHLPDPLLPKKNPNPPATVEEMFVLISKLKVRQGAMTAPIQPIPWLKDFIT